MTTLLITHSSSFEHKTPPGHPERVDRIRVLEQTLEDEKFSMLAREQAPAASLETIALAHPMEYVEAIRDASPAEGLVQLDSDTVMSPGSLGATLHAAGGVVLAIDEVLAGRADNAFVATRPPGHHAESARPMGFCLFNHIAVGARHAIKLRGAQRVAIVDFDVHHGNGSQEIFWNDPAVMYCSTHQMPLYPGTGARDERGAHDNIVNAPLRPGDGGDAFREAMNSVILPRLDAFGPDLVLVSAGFDAHARDPLASLNFVEDDFAWATGKLMDLADKRAQGRLVSVLEGGYDLIGLSHSAAAHVMTLMRG